MATLKMEKILSRLLPTTEMGSTLIVTDMPVSRQTHSSSGFGILTADTAL
jgi:hypothetical protein